MDLPIERALLTLPEVKTVYSKAGGQPCRRSDAAQCLGQLRDPEAKERMARGAPPRNR
jgi:hypothetical protein